MYLMIYFNIIVFMFILVLYGIFFCNYCDYA